nr:hypothetical protein [Tanacetum cinerariifolium]
MFREQYPHNKVQQMRGACGRAYAIDGEIWYSVVSSKMNQLHSFTCAQVGDCGGVAVMMVAVGGCVDCGDDDRGGVGCGGGGGWKVAAEVGQRLWWGRRWRVAARGGKWCRGSGRSGGREHFWVRRKSFPAAEVVAGGGGGWPEIMGWEESDKASLVRVPVANVTLSSSAHLLRENTDSFPLFAARVSLYLRFLLGLSVFAMVAACASRAAAIPSEINCQIVACVMAGAVDVDTLLGGTLST